MFRFVKKLCHAYPGKYSLWVQTRRKGTDESSVAGCNVPEVLQQVFYHCNLNASRTQWLSTQFKQQGLST